MQTQVTEMPFIDDPVMPKEVEIKAAGLAPIIYFSFVARFQYEKRNGEVSSLTRKVSIGWLHCR